VNAAPSIVDPQGSPGTEHPLALFADPQLVQVIATDTDGDDLVFVWNVPGHDDLQPTTSSDEGGLWSSYVRIPYDPDLDGDLVRVVVIDQSRAHNSRTVLFRVEVP
jgi:hypothetical protein